MKNEGKITYRDGRHQNLNLPFVYIVDLVFGVGLGEDERLGP